MWLKVAERRLEKDMYKVDAWRYIPLDSSFKFYPYDGHHFIYVFDTHDTMNGVLYRRICNRDDACIYYGVEDNFVSLLDMYELNNLSRHVDIPSEKFLDDPMKFFSSEKSSIVKYAVDAIVNKDFVYIFDAPAYLVNNEGKTFERLI